MTPHRAPTLAGYAFGSVRSALAVPVDTQGAVGAAVVAGLGFAFGAANLALLWVVGAAMLLDLVVGAFRAVIDPQVEFSVAKLYGGLLGKLFRSLFIPTASLIDWIYIVSPLPLPSGYDTAFPVTALAMLGLAAAEITSLLQKFQSSGVSPGLIAVVLRHVERFKAAPEPPPPHREEKP